LSQRRWTRLVGPWTGDPQEVAFEIDGRLLRATTGGTDFLVELSAESATEGWCRCNGSLYPFTAAQVGREVHVWLAGTVYRFDVQDRAPAAARPVGESQGTVTAAVPGKVARVFVGPGDIVEAGAKLVALESMKMEFVLQARGPGRVQQVLVKPGDQVQAGAPLVEIDEAA
jgi:biotin carboxyl carrier protein